MAQEDVVGTFFFLDVYATHMKILAQSQQKICVKLFGESFCTMEMASEVTVGALCSLEMLT